MCCDIIRLKVPNKGSFGGYWEVTYLKTSSVLRSQGPPPDSGGWLERHFSITQRGSTIGTEFRGGLTTFLTMAYIVVLNPLILSGVFLKEGFDLIKILGLVLTFIGVALLTLKS